MILAKGRSNAVTMGGPSNQDLEVRQNRERASVEQLVMEDAQSEAILYEWGSHSLMPSNVSCFESERGVFEADRELANSTSIAIGIQYSGTKGGVAVKTARNNEFLITYHRIVCRDLGGNPCGQKNRVMKGWGKVVDH